MFSAIRPSAFLSFVLGAMVWSTAARAVPCHTDKLPKWLKLSEYTFVLAETTGKHDVQVQLPDLFKLKCSAVHLDWGTDYHFQLTQNETVKVSILTEKGEVVRKFEIQDEELSAESPMLAVQREKTPHTIEIEDPDTHEKYTVYLRAKNGPDYVVRKSDKRQLPIKSYK